MNNILVRMSLDFGRMGEVESMFICNEDEYKTLPGKYVNFGEILGKHSDVSCELDPSDFEVVSEDQELILKLQELVGNSVCGVNPLHHFQE